MFLFSVIGFILVAIAICLVINSLEISLKRKSILLIFIILLLLWIPMWGLWFIGQFACIQGCSDLDFKQFEAVSEAMLPLLIFYPFWVFLIWYMSYRREKLTPWVIIALITPLAICLLFFRLIAVLEANIVIVLQMLFFTLATLFYAVPTRVVRRQKRKNEDLVPPGSENEHLPTPRAGSQPLNDDKVKLEQINRARQLTQQKDYLAAAELLFSYKDDPVVRKQLYWLRAKINSKKAKVIQD